LVGGASVFSCDDDDVCFVFVLVWILWHRSTSTRRCDFTSCHPESTIRVLLCTYVLSDREVVLAACTSALGSVSVEVFVC
jgi:hypothetical protein